MNKEGAFVGKGREEILTAFMLAERITGVQTCYYIYMYILVFGIAEDQCYIN